MNEKYRLVAIVVALVVVIAAGAVFVRSTQAPAPTPAATLGKAQVAVVSVSPTAPTNSYSDPETVTRAFFSAWEDARSHPKDLSNVMPFLLIGSEAVADTQAWAKQHYVDHNLAFAAADVVVTNCAAGDGPVMKRAPGIPTPRADLTLKHVVCQVTDTGQNTDLAGAPVGTHDPVWQYRMITEIQQFNGRWYVESWATCYPGQTCDLPA
jgi:hypothetical protein